MVNKESIEEWVHQFSKFTDTVDDWVDEIRGVVAKALGIEDPVRVLPYRGYGTAEKLLVKGRVLKDEGIKLKEQAPSTLDNIWNMYKRFATDEVENARLHIHFGTTHTEVTSDTEGFFQVEVCPPADHQDWDLWCPVDVSLVEPSPAKKSVLEKAEVLIVPDQASFGVISDIDDTIVHTAATDLLKMIRIVYLGSAESRQPFDGVAEFYSRLHQGHDNQSCNPIFYVSSSAWNMYDVFARFMELNDIPKGPIFLKDYEFSLESLVSFNHESHKLEQIQPIFDRFPDLSFLLIGDSGQRDPEIYSSLVEQYPNRVLGILIRDTVPHNQARHQELQAIANHVQAAGSQFHIFQETSEAMQFATEQGWLEPVPASMQH
jgi:phosphatidate phosphatase APP1